MSKMQLESFVQYGQLFEAYGKLLSADRQSILESYFTFNMTLAEIAKERNISRQAVLDAVGKGCDKLKNFEEVLGVVAQKQKMVVEFQELAKLAKDNREIKEKVEQILKDL